MIKLQGVEKTLGGQYVLKGVDLEIPTGQLTTIIGPSGEGKSVMLKHMIGLLRPDRGNVLVDGIDISRLKEKSQFQKLRPDLSGFVDAVSLG